MEQIIENECCANCGLCMRLTRADFRYDEYYAEYELMDGYICLAFADDNRTAVWMCECDANNTACDSYVPKTERAIEPWEEKDELYDKRPRRKKRRRKAKADVSTPKNAYWYRKG